VDAEQDAASGGVVFAEGFGVGLSQGFVEDAEEPLGCLCWAETVAGCGEQQEVPNLGEAWGS